MSYFSSGSVVVGDQAVLVRVVDDVEAGQPGVDVQAGDAHGVVVVPDGRRLLGVVVGEGGLLA